MKKTSVITTANGIVTPKKGRNPRVLYEHQEKAMKNLSLINKNSSYSTLVVLPTGGGKTYTAALWLLSNAIDKNKKILWLAHRKTLLEQAANTFQNYAYSETIPNRSEFRFRIISGDQEHDRPIDIRPDDDLLIISKDSVGRNLDSLDDWLKDEDEIFLVVDEAHHSTAKTYRKVIDYVRDKVKNLKLIGLTATPFRTAESERGLLAKIYTDGIEKNRFVHNDKGIAYMISLKELIKRQILSRPIIESYNTGEEYGKNLGAKDLERIQHFDQLPDNIVAEMTKNTNRNKFIVEKYVNNKKKYGQTIVFALNKPHAAALCALFNDYGVKSAYVISSVTDIITGATISSKDNEKAYEDYKSGKIQVLVNVNILTEGIDLPKTQTVFLARPTVSQILMTQMIGRALRGEKAGGTKDAYIVSFVDNGLDRIAWSSPETIFVGNNDFVDNEVDREKRDICLIAISKIEEFAKMLNQSADTKDLEKIPFIERIPIGMYSFTYLEESGVESSYQVMVYNSTKAAYNELMESLPIIIKDYETDIEYMSEDRLKEIASHCEEAFFLGEMVPPYDEKDIINILKFYIQNLDVPSFYEFKELEKGKIDAGRIAQDIIDKKLDPMGKAAYIKKIWEEGDENILRIYFRSYKYFLDQVDREINRIIYGNFGEEDDEDNVVYGYRDFEDMTLNQIRMYDPNYAKELRDACIKKLKKRNGKYICPGCGKLYDVQRLQVDHIKPFSKGGKTVPDNLQMLCRSCNLRKKDK